MSNNKPANFKPAQILENGKVKGPQCCGEYMVDDGDCGQGCCDDYRCKTCGYTYRVEWPD